MKCLNEETIGSCKKVLRPFEQRGLFGETFLRNSQGDPEVLLVIPFSEEVKVRAISMICGASKPEGIGL